MCYKSILILLISVVLFFAISSLYSMPVVPDGSGGGVIIYTLINNNQSHFYMINADGSDQTEISGLTGLNYSPTWSPDASQIAFYQHISDQQWSLYLMDSTGTNVQMLTNDVNSLDWAPSWKASGEKIIYTKSYTDPIWRSELWQINTDGSNQERIGTVEGQGADISPDGNRIVYFNYAENGGDIWSMDPDGTDIQQLTTHSNEDWWPNWSPDGTQIVFQAKRFGNFDIYKMNADGTSQMRLTNSNADDEEPRWSPDGTKIVFTSKRDGHSEIYMMDANGSNEERLTYSDGQAMNPDWKPVLSYCGQTPPDDIPIRFGTGELLANQEWQWHGAPVFSPDGKEMFFAKYCYETTETAGGSEIWTTRLVNNLWTSPEKASFSNRIYSDNNPVYISQNILYFASQRNNGFLFKVTRVNGEWSAPQQVYVPIFSGHNFGNQFSIAENGNLYAELFNNNAGMWAGDLYCWTYQNNQYQYPPVNLSAVNSDSLDFCPFIDPMERFLIFSSNRLSGGYGHKLYISYRENNQWSAPIYMENVNNENYSVQPQVSRDGKYFFFNTVVNSNNDLGMNAYWVKTDLYINPISNDSPDNPSSDHIKVNTYPNPFNPECFYDIEMKESSHVQIDLFNIKGQKVRTLYQGLLGKGNHKIAFNGKDDQDHSLSSGIYFSKIKCLNEVKVIKSILIK